MRRKPAAMGCSQVVRHGTLTPAFAGSSPATPAKHDPLAQLAEHLTFNQGVWSSNLQWVIPICLLISPLVRVWRNGRRARLRIWCLWRKSSSLFARTNFLRTMQSRGYAVVAQLVERHLAKVEVASPSLVYRSTCGCSSMAELQPSKLVTWVRFPSPAPFFYTARLLITVGIYFAVNKKKKQNKHQYQYRCNGKYGCKTCSGCMFCSFVAVVFICRRFVEVFICANCIFKI